MNELLAFRNRQRTRPVDVRLLRKIILALLRDYFLVESCELCFHLVAVPEMTHLNERYLGHAGSTDVIAFDYAIPAGQASRRFRRAEPLLERASVASMCAASEICRDRRDACPTVCGDIFVCLDEAVAQARQFHTTWPAELVRYAIHGLLHLRGHDDQQPAARRKMKREENRLLRALGKRFVLAHLAKRRVKHRVAQSAF